LTWVSNAQGMRSAALAATMLVLSLPVVLAQNPHRETPRSAPQSRPSPSRPQNLQYQGRSQNQGQVQNQNRSARQYQGAPAGNSVQRTAPGGYPSNAARPSYAPGASSGRQIYTGPGQSSYLNPGRPSFANPGRSNSYPGAASTGPLGSWLNQHRNLPVQEQERMLRSDPSFNQLPTANQQRLVQQLRQVDQMPEEQRRRRLARADALARLSPQEQSQINLSGHRWASLPPDRQALMKRTFQDLRSVPPDQRQTVLNSGRYQNAFTPEERGILSDFLRVEPYEPSR